MVFSPFRCLSLLKKNRLLGQPFFKKHFLLTALESFSSVQVQNKYREFQNVVVWRTNEHAPDISPLKSKNVPH